MWSELETGVSEETVCRTSSRCSDVFLKCGSSHHMKPTSVSESAILWWNNCEVIDSFWPDACYKTRNNETFTELIISILLSTCFSHIPVNTSMVLFQFLIKIWEAFWFWQLDSVFPVRLTRTGLFWQQHLSTKTRSVMWFIWSTKMSLVNQPGKSPPPSFFFISFTLKFLSLFRVQHYENVQLFFPDLNNITHDVQLFTTIYRFLGVFQG